MITCCSRLGFILHHIVLHVSPIIVNISYIKHLKHQITLWPCYRSGCDERSHLKILVGWTTFDFLTLGWQEHIIACTVIRYVKKIQRKPSLRNPHTSHVMHCVRVYMINLSSEVETAMPQSCASKVVPLDAFQSLYKKLILLTQILIMKRNNILFLWIQKLNILPYFMANLGRLLLTWINLNCSMDK